MESDLVSMKSDLDENERQYNSTGNEYYRIQYNNLEGKHNDLYKEYYDGIDDYNAKVKEYNTLIGAN